MTTYSQPHKAPHGGAWFVTETTGDRVVSIMVVNPNDTTAAEPTPYDPRCSMCWLGYAHSGQVHRERLT